MDEPRIGHKMVAACSGALITSLLVTPFDVVKTRMQTSSSTISIGTLHRMRHIATNESISALWKGLSPTLLMSLPATTIYYIGYEFLRDSLHSTPLSLYAPIVAGASSRLIAAVVISPIELVRTRMQSSRNIRLNETLVDLRNMVRGNGVVYLWRGLGPTLWRDVPFSAVYWFGYEFIKRRLIASENSFNEYPKAVPFFAGAMSGIIAATVTTPFDVAKTLQQVDHGIIHTCNQLIQGKRTQSMYQILTRIFQTEGVRGLFRGLSPRVAKVSPSCAIMISTYEFGKSFLE